MKKQIPDSPPNFLRRRIHADGIELRSDLVFAAMQLNLHAGPDSSGVAMRVRPAVPFAFSSAEAALAFSAFVMRYSAATEFMANAGAAVRSNSLIRRFRG